MSRIVGQMLSQRYRIEARLGQGGFGAVYRAWDSLEQRPAALKENLLASVEAQRQFNHSAAQLEGLAQMFEHQGGPLPRTHRRCTAMPPGNIKLRPQDVTPACPA